MTFTEKLQELLAEVLDPEAQINLDRAQVAGQAAFDAIVANTLNGEEALYSAALVLLRFQQYREEPDAERS